MMRLVLSLAILAIVATALIACGSNGRLLSLTISPLNPVAKDYPNGVVVFSATGTFSTPPTLVIPKVFWFACDPFTETNCLPFVGITKDFGEATCTGIPGPPGVPPISPIYAVANADINSTRSNFRGGNTKGIVIATTQMTCP